MTRKPAPIRLSRAGGVLLLVGGLALALAGWGIATLPTPAEEVAQGQEADQDLLDRFRLRLDHNARLQGSGLGLLGAGAILLAAGATPAGAAGKRGALAVGLGAAALVTYARWQSIDAAQFDTTWDHWVLAETVAWLLWSVALVALSISLGEREMTAPRQD